MLKRTLIAGSIAVVVTIAVLVFGSNNLPEEGRGVSVDENKAESLNMTQVIISHPTFKEAKGMPSTLQVGMMPVQE